MQDGMAIKSEADLLMREINGDISNRLKTIWKVISRKTVNVSTSKLF